jgi:hypothetical protein
MADGTAKVKVSGPVPDGEIQRRTRRPKAHWGDPITATVMASLFSISLNARFFERVDIDSAGPK